MTTRSQTVLLNELQQKLVQLKMKKEALVGYFSEIKGHTYRRAPQLEKLDNEIRAIEAEITLMEPTDAEQQQQSSSDFPRRGDQDGHGSSAAFRGQHYADASSDSAVFALLTWLLESLRGDANASPMVESTSQQKQQQLPIMSDREQDDCRYLCWVIASLNDWHAHSCVLQNPLLPHSWRRSVLSAAPPEYFENEDTAVLRQLWVEAAAHLDHATLRTVIHGVNTHSPHRAKQLFTISYEDPLESPQRPTRGGINNNVLRAGGGGGGGATSNQQRH